MVHVMLVRAHGVLLIAVLNLQVVRVIVNVLASVVGLMRNLSVRLPLAPASALWNQDIVVTESATNMNRALIYALVIAV
jgi:beta-lactamase regulating signal transducer with metallopeptidase domain